MDRAQIVQDGERQMVILPEMYQLSGQEVYISRSGTSLLLTPIVEEPPVLPAADDPWAILRSVSGAAEAAQRPTRDSE